jgi:hypothetical protein
MFDWDGVGESVMLDGGEFAGINVGKSLICQGGIGVVFMIMY